MSNTILIIEDDADIAMNMSRILEAANYKTYTAPNGKEGLELAAKNKPDLILSDIVMPELDGFAVLRAMENIPGMAGTPFIFLTGKSEAGDFRKAMDLGADDYLLKPFSGDELLRVVMARLKKQEVLKKAYNGNENETTLLKETKFLSDIKAIFGKYPKKKIRKKQLLYIEGEQPNFMYFIISGKVKVFKTNYFGKEYITEIYKDGDFCGFMALLDTGQHQTSAMAIEDSEIALISKYDFYQLLYSNNELSAEFIKFLVNNLTEAGERLLKTAYSSARKKVAEALLFISQKYTDHVTKEPVFPIYRDNISAIAGLSPESVSRNLSDFREEGLIQINKRVIKITDYKKLESLQ